RPRGREDEADQPQLERPDTHLRESTRGPYVVRSSALPEVPGGGVLTGHRCDGTSGGASGPSTVTATTEPSPGRPPESRQQDDQVNHGRPGASRGTGNGAIVSRRLVLAAHRRGRRGRVWRAHRASER